MRRRHASEASRKIHSSKRRQPNGWRYLLRRGGGIVPRSFLVVGALLLFCPRNREALRVSLRLAPHSFDFAFGRPPPPGNTRSIDIWIMVLTDRIRIASSRYFLDPLLWHSASFGLRRNVAEVGARSAQYPSRRTTTNEDCRESKRGAAGSRRNESKIVLTPNRQDGNLRLT